MWQIWFLIEFVNWVCVRLGFSFNLWAGLC
jgi:hypothetical protein